MVVGGGLGGLLAAGTAACAGKSVLVVERMPYVGGRFTTVDQDDFHITTGALHLVPHGAGGVLAAVMASMGQPFRGVPRDVIASAFAGGRHVAWRTPMDVLRLFGARGKADMLRICAELAICRTRSASTPFGAWVTSRTRDPTVRRLFEVFSQFALSVPADQISYGEMRAVLRNVVRHGLPCAPAGGCRALIEQLASGVTARGGQICTATEAVQIRRDPQSGRVCGLRVRDRRTGREQIVAAGTIVSDAGPDVTAGLLGEGSVLRSDSQSGGRGRSPSSLDGLLAAECRPVAAGFKLHVLSNRSLIDHRGIMFCLDTARISGIVQVSNAVPSTAPAGMHMLDTFQVPMTEDFALERRLAIEDLRQVFGAAFDRHCRVLRTSAFRAAWPVNRAIQGQDLREQEPVPGLLMVGDAYKQPGYMMVEGVASSVRAVADRLRA